MKDSVICECKYSNEIKSWNKHYHMTYEIIYIKKGNIELAINCNNYLINDNSIIYISCLEEHSIKILSNEYERYYINLSPKKLDKLISNPKLISIFKNRPIGFVHYFDAPECAESVFNVILSEYQNQDNFSEEIISNNIKELLITLFRLESNRFPIPSKNIKPEIFEVQKYIEKHFNENILISELADKFYINKYYLSHSFKELTGYSPKQYLLLNRLSYAKELLFNSALDISQISIQTGFYDSNSFIRAFKNEFGITPNAYRKS